MRIVTLYINLEEGAGLFLTFAHDQRKALVHVAAVGAHAVRLLRLAALGAADNVSALESMMSAAGPFARLRGLMKRKHDAPC
jgi:hypothetical protein